MAQRGSGSIPGIPPADALLPRVRRLADSPVGSRRSIAQLLLSEGSGITSLSMGEVARLSYTSKPSLVRFAQTLGFAG